jgi:AcrR family transcriptional regulator
MTNEEKRINGNQPAMAGHGGNREFGRKTMANKRKEQAERTRQKLLEVGQRLLSEKGYDGVTVSEITQACGVSKGTFYVYFTSKEQLVGSLQYTPYLELDDSLAEDTGPVIDCIKRYMIAWIDYFATYSPHFAASWLGRTNSENLDILSDYQDKYTSEADVAYARVDKIASRINRAIEQGELRSDCPSTQIASSIGTRLYGLCVWHSLSGGKKDIREMVKDEADLVGKQLETYKKGA